MFQHLQFQSRLILGVIRLHSIKFSYCLFYISGLEIAGNKYPVLREEIVSGDVVGDLL